jgi:hypothetical protein
MLVSDDGADDLQPAISPYLLSQARILREACRATGRDDHGNACPACVVRDFCETQARRAGKFDDALGAVAQYC